MILFNQNFYFIDNKHNQNNNKNKFIHFGVRNIPSALKPVKELTKDLFAKNETNISPKKLSSFFTEITVARKNSRISSSVFDQFFHDDFLNFLNIFDNMPKFNNKLFEKFVEAFRRCKIKEKSQEAALLKKIAEKYIRSGGDNSTVIEHCDTNFTSLFKHRNKSFLTAEQQTRLVEKNLGLIDWVIKQFFKSALLHDNNDLYKEFFQEGVLGLSIAAEQWNPRRGKIATYAPYWIRTKIGRFLANNTLVPLPNTARTRIRKIENFQEEFKEKNGYWPNNEDIIKATGISQSFVTSGKKRIILGSEMTPDGEDFVILDKLMFETNRAPVDNLIQREEAEMANKLLTENEHELTDREIDVLKLHFGFDDGEELNFAQIGETMNLSRERIRQIFDNAIRKLKMGICSKDSILNLIEMRKTIAANPEKRELLREEIKRLPQKSQDMLSLSTGLNGIRKKYREIAKKYRISEAAVRGDLDSIIKQLEKNKQFVEKFNS